MNWAKLEHYQLGNFLQTVESFDEAEGYYRKALELDPGHVDSINNLALLLHECKARARNAARFNLRRSPRRVRPLSVTRRLMMTWHISRRGAC